MSRILTTFDDIGILVQANPYGEGDLVVRLLTQQHGLRAGLVKGGNSRRMRGELEVGGCYSTHWRARLPENLGTFVLKPQGPLPSIKFLDDADRLLALQALFQVLVSTLTERDPSPELFNAVTIWLEQLNSDLWVHTLAALELRLLELLGFGLDLSKCASSGATSRLIYVSPKSGRAVSEVAGEPYKDRLLALPQYLIGRESLVDFEQEGIDALALTGRFLTDRVYSVQKIDLPWSRKALYDKLANKWSVSKTLTDQIETDPTAIS